jgi:hypothetical protein
MLDLVGRDADAVQRERNLLLIFDELEADGARAFRDVGIESLSRSQEALGDALGTGDDQGTGPLAHILRVDEEPSETAEMIAMQMADANHVDFVGREPEPVHANQRGDAAIDEKGGAVRPYVEGGLELSARAKSIPTP